MLSHSITYLCTCIDTVIDDPKALSNTPVITKHPQSQSDVVYGDWVTLTVSATGLEPLTYQWMKDGEAITENIAHVKHFDTPNLLIHPFSPEYEGNYTCVVSNVNKSVKSKSAELKGTSYH